MELDFYQPIIVPAGIEKILVIVTDGLYKLHLQKSFLLQALGDRDLGIKVVMKTKRLVTTTDLIPVPNANFYITVQRFKFKSITRITHNVCDDVKKTDCTFVKLFWARDFNLKDFGISPEFTINSGQVE
jgi:hypothetical protein